MVAFRFRSFGPSVYRGLAYTKPFSDLGLGPVWGCEDRKEFLMDDFHFWRLSVNALLIYSVCG